MADILQEFLVYSRWAYNAERLRRCLESIETLARSSTPPPAPPVHRSQTMVFRVRAKFPRERDMTLSEIWKGAR